MRIPTTGAAQTLLLVLLVISVTGALGEEGEENASVQEVTSDTITWLGYNEALATARDFDKPIFIHFTAPWCKWCVKMKKETYTDPDVIRYMEENFVSVFVDTEKLPSLARKYNVSSLPTLWFLTSGAEGLTAVQGYMGPGNFLPVLEYIGTKAYEEIQYDAWKRRRNKK
jgi:thioredoxin-related protein